MFRKFALLLVYIIPGFIQAQSYEPNYGIILNLNYPTLGGTFDNYIGRGFGSFGMYYQRPFNAYHSNSLFNSFDYTLEPAYSVIGFRDQQLDKLYTGNYIDFSGYLNYIPDRMSNDLRIILGLRPSVMINNATEKPDNNGGYTTSSFDPINQNSIGRFDISGLLGIGVSLGEVASLELKYSYSLTNNTTALIINGRPSYLEFGIRLSAIKIRDKLISNEKNIVAELNKRSQGTMLIMLESPNERLIHQLIVEKRSEDADFVRSLQLQTNKNIMAQFAKYFTFCKVLYFMDTEADKVSRRNFNNVFIDQNLTPIPEVSFDTSNYMLGSFCEDVSDYTRKPDYGLYIYDGKFIQLDKPYNTVSNNMGIYIGGDPLNYFRRIKTSGYHPEEFGKVIRKFNDRLHRIKITGT
ncbi:MAG: hypothetical protein H7296_09910 [Bacteroidia bacterium]|nr:hypothetical protein [Bacteroidia bacterium]